jgi:hypothetical protein
MSIFNFVVCLQVMGTMGFYFLTTLALLLCLCWMHFWWCGVVCAEALMEESQGVENENKEGVNGWALGEFDKSSMNRR